MLDYWETDVLVIGCGIAGGVAALELADAGISVTVVTRAKKPQESNTFYAQGGIIYRGETDSPALLTEDVKRAGARYCYDGAVKLLSEVGPTLVRDILLERVGVAFDRTPSGELSLALEGGHSLPRIIHAADATGKAISVALINTLEQHPNVTLLSGFTALDLLTSDQHQDDHQSRYISPACLGAYLLAQDIGEVMTCVARRTILATGGLGQIYQRTTNPRGARGDGVAMAARAGVRILNMEYVQFHPTTFYHPEAQSFLISEAVRGAGARLVHADGTPFMDNYDPEWRDLAPRDVVSRSIQAEMARLDLSNVYLDLRSYIARAEIYAHFPTIYQTCFAYGVDITRDLVPVVPAAHYACGGIWVDEVGQTTLSQLYAVGEVACTGLHGANRLASTSLLEGVVWGSRAAQHLRQCLLESTSHVFGRVQPYAQTIKPLANERHIQRDLQAIQHLMWHRVGLVRKTVQVEAALRKLRHLQADIDSRYTHHYPTDALVGLRNIVQVALLVTVAALQNKVAAGCHYRV